MPIHALVENGCKDIIALRIFGFGIEKRFRIPDDVHVTTIGPTVDLGNILNFDAEQSRRNMRLGYFDAQRVLYGLYGSTYYIDRTMSEDAARQQLLEYLGTDDGSLRTFHEKTLPQIAKAL
ncbi:patatin, partial [human gut metagenome]